VEEKADKSPLTLADKRSHDIIVSRLSPFDIPLLSEEGRSIDYSVRSHWKTLWMVDPLDGTKEFVKKNGEFTINIALICEQRPVMGVIYVPVLNHLFFAAKDIGAFFMPVDPGKEFDAISLDHLISMATAIDIRAKSARPFTIVGSRSHATPELEAYVLKKRKEHDTVEFISAGSSLKFCQVATGKADVYPRLGPTMEWDTAAGHVIAECAGASIFRADDNGPLLYNKENLLNPWFYVSNGRH
jgi:3'(2'), 5'-bisphosphate nucleotidase